jgi:gliding motility-associated-like protein
MSAQSPVASFTYSHDPNGPCIYATSTSTGSIQSWTWYVDGNAVSASGTNFNHCFSDTGCYAVKLVVQDMFGISDSTTQEVCIELESMMFMPNVFTPNGDNINDVFYVYGTFIQENTFEMRIFDYWGSLIYASFDVHQGWKGEANDSGRISPNGYYLVEVIWFDTDSNKHTYRGAVLMIK